MKHLYEIFCRSSGICTDTRKLMKDQLFFALKGDNFDGNKFAAQALEKGASYAVIDDPTWYPSEIENRYILVDSVLETLQNLAIYHRNQVNIPVIGLTGSNGKTTTKELITTVLASIYKVRSTEGNLNNHIGVPLTVLSITGDDEIAVVEMGANHIGEIQHLCTIANPTVGIITNIGYAHLEGFGSYEGVIKAKTELYDYIDQNNGLLFVNADDETLKKLIPKGAVVKFTHTKELVHIDATFPHLTFILNGAKWSSQLSGSYNLDNVLYAAAIGNHFGVDETMIKSCVESYVPNNNRSQVKQIGTNTYILDHYNANPSSMSLSIENLASSDYPQKVLILGDMNELGAYAVEAHEKIIELVNKYSWHHVYTVGSIFNTISSNMYKRFNTSIDLKKYLDQYPIEGSTVLLKGSRGVGLEKIFS